MDRALPLEALHNAEVIAMTPKHLDALLQEWHGLFHPVLHGKGGLEPKGPVDAGQVVVEVSALREGDGRDVVGFSVVRVAVPCGRLLEDAGDRAGVSVLLAQSKRFLHPFRPFLVVTFPALEVAEVLEELRGMRMVVVVFIGWRAARKKYNIGSACVARR